ncbi:Reverse transcriptase, RNA-dependent DNA polymerase [Metarhizium guizhouense ARSEF 977]|uniref:Reverse transcriptase, RNA-dependent DNA polymerase n=1 Tax=Metarhizium guizhouense (strain ARSEF 977) TaxID=1276136 RepID=A0A0B4GMR2_METGA|nr:Reverse transcriptase, RNA-dependent DNA polymerase [Metarhizium guizhouense ARSEF 977]
MSYNTDHAANLAYDDFEIESALSPFDSDQISNLRPSDSASQVSQVVSSTTSSPSSKRRRTPRYLSNYYSLRLIDQILTILTLRSIIWIDYSTVSDRTEIDALQAQSVFRFETYDPVKHGTDRLFKSRLVREIKGKGTTTPYEKSRLVIQGHSDNGKQTILTQSPTIQRSSQRLIVALVPSLASRGIFLWMRDITQALETNFLKAQSSQRLIVALVPSLASRGIFLWMRDITQAYVQSTTKLNRTILARPPDQIRDQFPEGTIMVVVKPLYGIAEAGTHWWATYFNHHRENLRMTTSTFDPCLLVTTTRDCFGITGMQTDDTLGLGDQRFFDLEEEQLQKAKFTAKPKEIGL